MAQRRQRDGADVVDRHERLAAVERVDLRRRARSPAPRAGWRRSARTASPAASRTAKSGCVPSVRRIA